MITKKPHSHQTIETSLTLLTLLETLWRMLVTLDPDMDMGGDMREEWDQYDQCDDTIVELLDVSKIDITLITDSHDSPI